MAITETLVAFVAVFGGSITAIRAILKQIVEDDDGVTMLFFFFSSWTMIIGVSQVVFGFGIFWFRSYAGLGETTAPMIMLNLLFFIDSVPIEISSLIIISTLLYLILSLEGFTTGTGDSESDDSDDDGDRLRA